MSMERCKDADWPGLPNEYPYVHVRVLQDIRDELKELNALLHCQNFTGIPFTLAQIKRNTTKPKKRKVRK